MRARLTAVCVGAILSVAVRAGAHPVPFSFIDLHVRPQGLEGTLVVHILDAAHDLNLGDANRLLDQATLYEQAPRLVALLSSRLHVTVDGVAVRPQLSDVAAVPARQSVRMGVHIPLSGGFGVVSFGARLFPYDAQHQTFLNIYDGDRLTQGTFDRSRSHFNYFPGTRQGTFAVVQGFLSAGIHHILVGPDHLLFLAGLLLLGGSFRTLAKIVTAFTVGHSVTLSLAALNLVAPPARIVEPAIALSVVYVGIHNLRHVADRDSRFWIAFAFGFIHGFGFASILREMSLPVGRLGLSLYSFNLGVEIGQLAVVAPVAAVFAGVRARSEAAGRQLVVGGSLVVIAGGAFWFLQRTLFSSTL